MPIIGNNSPYKRKTARALNLEFVLLIPIGKLVVFKLKKNERLQQISFHTFRHQKATMEDHKTRDILHVIQML